MSAQLTNSSSCELPFEHNKKLRLSWPLFLILVLFVILGSLYNLITPIFEKPDEPKHYAYVKYVADGRGLPLFATDERPLWRQEATQGPLFYTLAALGTFWIDDSDFEVLIRENPHYLGGQGAWGDNSNRFVHTDREAFPYRGATLAVRVARFIALFIGAIAVAATYGIARIIFPARPALAVGAAALVAFNPMFLFISSSVSNDSTVAAASALTVLAGLRALRASPPTGRHFLALGLAWSLAVLAKSSALALGPWIGLILIGTGWREKSIGSFLRRASIVGGLSLLLAGWWYASTWVIHGDLLGTATHAARFGRRDPMPTVLQLLPELEGLEESFWALFGWRNLPVDERLYVLFAALDRMALLGWAILLVRQVRKRGWTRHQWLAVTLTWLWFSLALATVMRWMQLSTWGNTGRLLYSGLSAIALLLALGWSAFLPDDKSRYLLGALAGILLIIAVACPFLYIAPAYARPAPLSESDLQVIPQQLTATFDEQIALLGYEVSTSAVQPGEELTVTLYWRALSRMAADYSVFVHLLDENDVIVAQRDTYPGRGNLPTSRWRTGEAIADTYRLLAPQTAYAPSTGLFEVGLYSSESGHRLPTADGTDNVRFASIAIRPRQGPVPNPVRFNFGHKIALVGYDFGRRAGKPGETLRLTLYWEALVPMEESYTVFAHVLGQGTQVWAIGDGVPVKGLAPTFTWQPGQIVEDSHDLTIGQTTPPGVYDIEVGLYLAETGQRLKLLAGDGFPLDTRVFLSKIRVIP